MVLRVAFMRHGHDDSDTLSPLGIKQVTNVGEQLVQLMKSEGSKFSAVLYSPKYRTKKSADILNALFNAAGLEANIFESADGLKNERILETFAPLSDDITSVLAVTHVPDIKDACKKMFGKDVFEDSELLYKVDNAEVKIFEINSQWRNITKLCPGQASLIHQLKPILGS